MAVNDKKNPVAVTLTYLIVSLMTFVFVFPFYVVIVSAFTDPIHILRGFPLFWPSAISLENFETIFHSPVLWRAAFLSVTRTILGTILTVTCCALTAYALSRQGLPGKKFFNRLFLITMFFSGGLIPMYIMIRAYGLINNFLVFLLPGMINVFYVLIIKSYYAGLPQSVEDSAIIDGCNDIQVFFKMIVPMSLPVLAAIGVYTSVGHWNSWWDNYIYANKDSLLTLQLLLVRLVRNADATSLMAGSDFADVTQTSPFGVRMATTVLVTTPILIAYPALQKYFITGITIGAVKG